MCGKKSKMLGMGRLGHAPGRKQLAGTVLPASQQKRDVPRCYFIGRVPPFLRLKEKATVRDVIWKLSGLMLNAQVQ
jgi:hypothetical protein